MKKLSILTLSALTLLISCNKEVPVPTPKLSSYTNVTNINHFAADVSIDGHVFNSDQSYNWGFFYSTDPNPKHDQKVTHNLQGNSCDFTSTIFGLTDSTTYYVQPFCEAYGAYTYNDDIISFTTPVDNTIIYEVGDIGPGGGLVYSSDGSGGGMELSNTEFLGDWGCTSPSLPGCILNAGSGGVNTALILTNCPSTVSAPAQCANYQQGGYDDWYLPSFGDLFRIYNNLVFTGLWTPMDNIYVSSTQGPTNVEYAYYGIRMLDGSYGYYSKDVVHACFPVRSF